MEGMGNWPRSCVQSQSMPSIAIILILCRLVLVACDDPGQITVEKQRTALLSLQKALGYPQQLAGWTGLGPCVDGKPVWFGITSCSDQNLVTSLDLSIVSTSGLIDGPILQSGNASNPSQANASSVKPEKDASREHSYPLESRAPGVVAEDANETLVQKGNSSEVGETTFNSAGSMPLGHGTVPGHILDPQVEQTSQAKLKPRNKVVNKERKWVRREGKTGVQEDAIFDRNLNKTDGCKQGNTILLEQTDDISSDARKKNVTGSETRKKDLDDDSNDEDVRGMNGRKQKSSKKAEEEKPRENKNVGPCTEDHLQMVNEKRIQGQTPNIKIPVQSSKKKQTKRKKDILGRENWERSRDEQDEEGTEEGSIEDGETVQLFKANQGSTTSAGKRNDSIGSHPIAGAQEVNVPSAGSPELGSSENTAELNSDQSDGGDRQTHQSEENSKEKVGISTNENGGFQPTISDAEANFSGLPDTVQDVQLEPFSAWAPDPMPMLTEHSDEDYGVWERLALDDDFHQTDEPLHVPSFAPPPTEMTRDAVGEISQPSSSAGFPNCDHDIVTNGSESKESCALCGCLADPWSRECLRAASVTCLDGSHYSEDCETIAGAMRSIDMGNVQELAKVFQDKCVGLGTPTADFCWCTSEFNSAQCQAGWLQLCETNMDSCLQAFNAMMDSDQEQTFISTLTKQGGCEGRVVVLMYALGGISSSDFTTTVSDKIRKITAGVAGVALSSVQLAGIGDVHFPGGRKLLQEDDSGVELIVLINAHSSQEASMTNDSVEEARRNGQLEREFLAAGFRLISASIQDLDPLQTDDGVVELRSMGNPDQDIGTAGQGGLAWWQAAIVACCCFLVSMICFCWVLLNARKEFQSTEHQVQLTHEAEKAKHQCSVLRNPTHRRDTSNLSNASGLSRVRAMPDSATPQSPMRGPLELTRFNESRSHIPVAQVRPPLPPGRTPNLSTPSRVVPPRPPRHLSQAMDPIATESNTDASSLAHKKGTRESGMLTSEWANAFDNHLYSEEGLYSEKFSNILFNQSIASSDVLKSESSAKHSLS